MNKNKGFTLIELLVAVTVFMVIASIAAPNLRGFVERNATSNQTNLLVANLNLARSEAVKRNQQVSICNSNSAQTACVTPGDPTPWEDGWLVFVDTDTDGTLDAGETILRVSEPSRSGHTIRSTQYIDTLFYNGDGSISTAGTFRICDKDANVQLARAINIGASGIISTARDTDSNIIRNDFQGNDIACP